MIWALVNNIKKEATPKSFGKCPLCNRKVISKCGEIKVWHWAHEKDNNCDSWYEPETDWHLHWKMTFGKENAEIILKKNNEKHIADILTNNNVVIELQNSPIQKPIIRKRENFYGERMIWLVNGIHFEDNFEILKWDSFDIYDKLYYKKNGMDVLPFNWKWARKSWDTANRNVFIDFGKESLFWVLEGMGSSSGIGKYVSKKKLIDKYDGNFEYYKTKL